MTFLQGDPKFEVTLLTETYTNRDSDVDWTSRRYCAQHKFTYLHTSPHVKYLAPSTDIRVGQIVSFKLTPIFARY